MRLRTHAVSLVRKACFEKGVKLPVYLHLYVCVDL